MPPPPRTYNNGFARLVLADELFRAPFDQLMDSFDQFMNIEFDLIPKLEVVRMTESMLHKLLVPEFIGSLPSSYWEEQGQLGPYTFEQISQLIRCGKRVCEKIESQVCTWTNDQIQTAFQDKFMEMHFDSWVYMDRGKHSVLAMFLDFKHLLYLCYKMHTHRLYRLFNSDFETATESYVIICMQMI